MSGSDLLDGVYPLHVILKCVEYESLPGGVVTTARSFWISTGVDFERDIQIFLRGMALNFFQWFEHTGPGYPSQISNIIGDRRIIELRTSLCAFDYDGCHELLEIYRDNWKAYTLKNNCQDQAVSFYDSITRGVTPTVDGLVSSRAVSSISSTTDLSQGSRGLTGKSHMMKHNTYIAKTKGDRSHEVLWR